MAELQRKRERGEKSRWMTTYMRMSGDLPSSGSLSPECHSRRCWACPEPGASSGFPTFIRVQVLGLSSGAFRCTLSGSCITGEAAESQTSTWWASQAAFLTMPHCWLAADIQHGVCLSGAEVIVSQVIRFINFIWTLQEASFLVPIINQLWFCF